MSGKIHAVKYLTEWLFVSIFIYIMAQIFDAILYQ